MSYSVFENTLSKLLTDEAFLNLFIFSPEKVVNDLDLIADEKLALLQIDRDELQMAARSFRKKLSHRCESKKKPIWKRLFTFRSIPF